MERLTKFDYENYRALKPKQDVVDKLGELEDVLEEFELTSAEDLRNHLNFKDNMAIWEGKLELKNKIADLEQELAELKQKAIVPKFQANQETWYYHIGNNKIYSGIIEDMQWRPVNGMYYRIPNLQRDYYWIREDELFATREEAEQRLAEIGDKDE